MKLIWIVLCLWLGSPGGNLQAQEMKGNIEKAWQEFNPQGKNPVREVVKEKGRMNKQIGSDKDLLMLNEVCALNRMAEYLKTDGGKGVKIAGLKKVWQSIDLSSPDIVKVEGLPEFLENFYALKFIGEGAPIADAWGSMWFNTTVETLGNEYDYKRYAAILETRNPCLMEAYLGILRKVFRYNGYTQGMENIRSLFEKNFPEGNLKKEIAALYESYFHLREGAEAPVFDLPDFKGNIHRLEDYRGKVLVIDVWATWCGGCIQKLPEFMKMQEAYKNRQDIEFITISIDEQRSFKTWKYTLPRLKLMGVTNLLAASENCSFDKDYNITGIPRYFLIDREGKIVSVYAPTPGEDFKRLIDKTLNK